jgi:hypothetical protein
MTSDSFHFIGIYQGSTARCNSKKRSQLFIGTRIFRAAQSPTALLALARW